MACGADQLEQRRLLQLTPGGAASGDQAVQQGLKKTHDISKELQTNVMDLVPEKLD